MRVTNSTFTDTLVNQVQRLSGQQVELQKQISSGQRVTLPDDDPAAVDRIMQMQSDKRLMVQYRRNHVQGEAITNISQGALESMSNLTTRILEIATRAGELTKDSDMALYGGEIDQLLEQILQAGNSTYKGEHIFSGDDSKTAPLDVVRDVDGQITSASYVGSNTNTEFFVAQGTKISVHLDPSHNAKFVDLLNKTVSLRDALKAADKSAVATTRTDLISSEDDILLAISDMGATQLRLEVAKAQDNDSFTLLETQISAEADGDLTKLLVELNQIQLALQATMQSGSRLMGRSILDFI